MKWSLLQSLIGIGKCAHRHKWLQCKAGFVNIQRKRALSYFLCSQHLLCLPEKGLPLSRCLAVPPSDLGRRLPRPCVLEYMMCHKFGNRNRLKNTQLPWSLGSSAQWWLGKHLLWRSTLVSPTEAQLHMPCPRAFKCQKVLWMLMLPLMLETTPLWTQGGPHR